MEKFWNIFKKDKPPKPEPSAQRQEIVPQEPTQFETDKLESLNISQFEEIKETLREWTETLEHIKTNWLEIDTTLKDYWSGLVDSKIKMDLKNIFYDNFEKEKGFFGYRGLVEGPSENISQEEYISDPPQTYSYRRPGWPKVETPDNFEFWRQTFNNLLNNDGQLSSLNERVQQNFKALGLKSEHVTAEQFKSYLERPQFIEHRLMRELGYRVFATLDNFLKQSSWRLGDKGLPETIVARLQSFMQAIEDNLKKIDCSVVRVPPGITWREAEAKLRMQRVKNAMGGSMSEKYLFKTFPYIKKDIQQLKEGDDFVWHGDAKIVRKGSEQIMIHPLIYRVTEV